MRSIRLAHQGEPTIFACIHYRTFPPPYMSPEIDPEYLRATREIDGAEYQRLMVWKRTCGLYRMDPEKCLTCEHVRKVVNQGQVRPPVLQTLDGSQSIPIVDITTLESAPQRAGRTHLVTNIDKMGKAGR